MARLDEPQVSVIIPAFNASRYIAETIESVLRQTVASLEIVVVDDGSTDDTATIASSFQEPRLRVLSQPNAGVAAARNKGAFATGGDLIAFLDADDQWLPEKLERQIALFRDRPSVGVVGCLMRYVSPEGRSLGIAGEGIDESSRVRVMQGRLMPFPTSSSVYRRSSFERLGGFNEDLPRQIPGQVEDIDLISRLACDEEVGCVEELLGLYRVHRSSASARHFASQRIGMRFVQESRKAEARGETLRWEDFSSRYRSTLRERYRDRIAALYRAAGVNVAERRWLRGAAAGVAALVLGPHYSLARLRRQRPWRRGVGTAP